MQQRLKQKTKLHEYFVHNKRRTFQKNFFYLMFQMPKWQKQGKSGHLTALPAPWKRHTHIYKISIPVLSSSFLFLSIIPKMGPIILDKAINNNTRMYFINLFNYLLASELQLGIQGLSKFIHSKFQGYLRNPVFSMAATIYVLLLTNQNVASLNRDVL